MTKVPSGMILAPLFEISIMWHSAEGTPFNAIQPD
jgi:hypothetical protein